MKIIYTLLLTFATISAQAQESRSLEAFSTIVTGPHIQLNLTPGLNESVVLETNSVDHDKIICEVRGKRLHIYLKDARNIEKQQKYRDEGRRWTTGIYNNVTVIAHVTYRQLYKLVTKGEEDITVHGSVGGEKFKFKSFGDQKVSFENIATQKFSAKLYGSTRLKIENGYADLQRYKLYGEHRIQTDNVRSQRVRAANFGDLDMQVSSDVVQLTSFGIADIKSNKPVKVQKGIVIGETRIRSGTKS